LAIHPNYANDDWVFLPLSYKFKAMFVDYKYFLYICGKLKLKKIITMLNNNYFIGVLVLLIIFLLVFDNYNFFFKKKKGESLTSNDIDEELEKIRNNKDLKDILENKELSEGTKKDETCYIDNAKKISENKNFFEINKAVLKKKNNCNRCNKRKG